MQSFLREQVRRDIGRQYVDTTLEVLEMPQVIDALGEEALAMSVILQSSFVPPRKGSDVVVPPEQQAANNVAIYPILPTELRPPIMRRTDWLQPSDRERLVAEDPISYTIQRSRDFQLKPQGRLAAIRARRDAQDDRHPALHRMQSLTFQRADGSWDMAWSRSIIFADTRVFSKLSQIALAALMSHEIQHARQHAMASQDLEPAERVTVLMYGKERLSTLDERYAYTIQYGLMHALNPDGPSVVTFARNIHGLDPDEATSRLAGLIEKYAAQDPCGDDHLQALAAGALAITWVFGDPEAAILTEDEIAAYKKLGYTK